MDPKEVRVHKKFKVVFLHKSSTKMGAAASTESHSTTVQQFRQTVLDGKPLDASDMKVSSQLEVSNDCQIDLMSNLLEFVSIEFGRSKR